MMKYSDFVTKAQSQDKRNVFSKYNGEIDLVPEQIKEFYKNINPIDVEIISNGNSIRFYQLSELIEIQKEYKNVVTGFVFASCNGDPIYIAKGKVFTCAHGVKNPDFEFLADNFDSYLDSLL
jgi:hypothetical protein